MREKIEESKKKRHERKAAQLKDSLLLQGSEYQVLDADWLGGIQDSNMIKVDSEATNNLSSKNGEASSPDSRVVNPKNHNNKMSMSPENTIILVSQTRIE